jgi:uncharacterized membrane protein YdfJ with MMPL/SSD domain
VPIFLFSVLFGLSMDLDATLVRLLLIPAAMRLLGERNWYLPSWLSWLPDLQVEGQQPRRPPANVPSDDARSRPAPSPSAPDRHKSGLTR